MKILLYGGTFDPPHYGHINNLRAAAQCVKPEKIIVMPAGVPPHKHASATPGTVRMEMCGCFHALEQAYEPAAELTVSGWEIEQAECGRQNYTVLTLEMLARKEPDAQLYLTVGSDMLLSFDQWYRWRDILQLAVLVVVSRDEGDMPALQACAARLDPSRKRIMFAHVKALPMASSALRARIAAGETCTDELPESVRAIIRRENLYVSAAEK